MNLTINELFENILPTRIDNYETMKTITSSENKKKIKESNKVIH